MSYKTAFRDVIRDYQIDRDKSAALLKKRKDEVYESLPKLKELDEAIAQSALTAAKQILTIGEKNKDIEKWLTSSQNLIAEKKQLLTENNIPEDYLTNIYRCTICEDTGYVENNRCRCLKQRMIDKYYDLSNIRDLLAIENFESFDIRYYSQTVDPIVGISPYQNIQRIYRISMDFVNEFKQSFQNLLFYGDTGLGKTFMCNCIAKDLLDAGHTVLYVTAPQIFKLVEDYRFNRNDMEEPDYVIDAVTDVDLLVLDDLGAEFSTVVTSAALFDIINQRLLAKKSTVISTNLSLVEFEAQYSARIFSRFLGHYRMSKFIGDDIRAKKKYEGG